MRSFRSNAVLRWEWRPGSMLYLVWQRDRFDFQNHGARVGPGSLWDTLQDGGNNHLALKLTYWIPVS
ncbi:MAG TPA: hypothetical protein VGR37_00015 [Longimicrobiaceae bacterium]|nr:hypothetical protein [Longimicrobiaceae bacterium]